MTHPGKTQVTLVSGEKPDNNKTSINNDVKTQAIPTVGDWLDELLDKRRGYSADKVRANLGF